MLGASSMLIFQKMKSLQKPLSELGLCLNIVQFLTFNTSKNLQSNTGSKKYAVIL